MGTHTHTHWCEIKLLFAWDTLCETKIYSNIYAVISKPPWPNMKTGKPQHAAIEANIAGIIKETVDELFDMLGKGEVFISVFYIWEIYLYMYTHVVLYHTYSVLLTKTST